MARIIHITSETVRVGNVVRQRCGWCGRLLSEVDLANVAVHPPPENWDDVAKGFATGAVVFEEALEGGGTFWGIIDHVNGDPMPAGWCGYDGPQLKAVSGGAER